MRILIFGAGVIGSVFGGKLAEAGHEVTFLARDGRKRELEAEGLQLVDGLKGTETILHPPVMDGVTESVAGDCDLVIVAIRDAQIDGALQQIRALSEKAPVLFMLNCPLRVGQLLEALGEDRAFFAFPGAGGVHDGHRIRYTAVRQQPTTFGPVRGQPDRRPRELATLFSGAGLSVDLVPDMEAWLLTHAVMITALCGVLYRNGGSSKALARDSGALDDMIAGLAEGLAAISALGFTPSPTKLRLLSRLPRFVGRFVLSRLFASDFAEFAIDGHANAAPEDMRDLAGDCRAIVARSGVAAPALLGLCVEVDAFAERAARRRTA